MTYWHNILWQLNCHFTHRHHCIYTEKKKQLEYVETKVQIDTISHKTSFDALTFQLVISLRKFDPKA